MKKNTKMLVFAIVLAIAGIVALNAVGINNLTALTALYSGCGYNVISLSNAYFTSNDPVLQLGKSVLMNIVWSTQNECAYGTIAAADVNNKVPGDDSIQYDFDVYLKSLEQSCNYKITSRLPANPAGKYGQLFSGVYSLSSSSQACESSTGGCANVVSQCQHQPNYVDSAAKCYDIFSLNCQAYCFFANPVGWQGTIGNPSYSFPVEISLRNSAGQVLSSAQVDGHGANSALLGTPTKAYVEWNGYLASGVSCPEPSGDNYAIYEISTGKWHANNKNYWSTYSPYDSGGFQSCLNNAEYGSVTNFVSAVTSCMNTYNTMAANVYAKESQIIWNWAGSYVQDTSGDTSAGTIKLTVHRAIAYPSLTLHVSADWLGIFSPAGDTQIVSVSPSSIAFTSTDSSTISVTVKNKGTAADTISVGATCTNGFYADNESDSIQAGVTKTYLIPITSTCTGTKTGSCTVTVNGKTKADTWPSAISATCRQMPQCTVAGQKRCSPTSNYIQECTNQVWANQENCQFGCDPFGPSCKGTPPSCTSNEQCNDNLQCTTDECVAGSCIHNTVPNCGCLTDTGCNDNDACTTDSCASGTCLHAAIPNCGEKGFDWEWIAYLLIPVLAGIVAWIKGGKNRVAWVIFAVIISILVAIIAKTAIDIFVKPLLLGFSGNAIQCGSCSGLNGLNPVCQLQVAFCGLINSVISAALWIALFIGIVVALVVVFKKAVLG